MKKDEAFTLRDALFWLMATFDQTNAYAKRPIWGNAQVDMNKTSIEVLHHPSGERFRFSIEKAP